MFNKAKLNEIYRAVKDVFEAIDNLDIESEEKILVEKGKLNGTIRTAAGFKVFALKAINEKSKTFNLGILNDDERDRFIFCLGFLIAVSPLFGNEELYEALKDLYSSLQV